MADLKTNYKDDVLDTSVNEKRKFKMIQNEDGTVSFEDVTEYTQTGDSFGAADFNATNTAVNEVNSNLGIDLLWTNPSPTSTFEPQTLNIDLSSYKWVIIEFKYSTNVDYFETSFTPIDGQIHIGHVIVSRINYRGFIASSDKIVFDNGVEVNTYNTVTSNPSDAIPVKIFGVK